MDPLTMFAIAQVGVGAVQSIWNYFAGQDALSAATDKLDKQQTFLNDRANLLTKQHTLQNDQIDKQAAQQTAALDNRAADLKTQVTQAGVDLTKSVASGQAGLAQSGLVGPMATMVTDQAQTDGQTRIDTFKSQAERDIAAQRQQVADATSFAKQSSDLSYAGGLQSIKESQFGLDSGYTDLKGQQSQLNMDAWMSALGVGMSAAGTLVKSDIFKKKV